MHQYDEDAGYRHQKEHERMLTEKLLGISNTKPKGRPHQAVDPSPIRREISVQRTSQTPFLDDPRGQIFFLYS